MPARAVKQPNGLYARFSTIVDDFTDFNCSRDELWTIFRDECGVECANGKMQRADENHGRFEEEIQTILFVHGDKVAKERCKELSESHKETL